jgi:hypothetical protein
MLVRTAAAWLERPRVVLSAPRREASADADLCGEDRVHAAADGPIRSRAARGIHERERRARSGDVREQCHDANHRAVVERDVP